MSIIKQSMQHKLTLLLSISGALAFSLPLSAQDETPDDETANLEQVVVVGSRTAPRTATDSPVPIDVIGADDFTRQGNTDLNALLRSTVPSYNVSAQAINDAATLIRPANLRGLPSDSTLVLVNGKRRHRAAVISFLGGGLNDGAQGPDTAAIPSIALKQVEVLRDGAAAQYGSDAIAGVINFVLKNDADGALVEFRHGSFFEGDGDSTQIAGNIGMPFTANGYANFSFQIKENDPTSRSVQRDDALALIAAGNTDVRTPAAQIWGSPEISETALFMNIGLDLNDRQKFYIFGNWSERDTLGGFYYRNPDTRGAVYGRSVGIEGFDENGAPMTSAVDANGNPVSNIYNESGVLTTGSGLPGTFFHRLVGDITGNLSGNCPSAGTFGGATAGLAIENEAGLQNVINDPNCFVFNEIFPGGFTPQFGGTVVDTSLVAGVSGEFDNGVGYDFSASFGHNSAAFEITNTINSSLGPDTPTSFKPGTYAETDTGVNLDFTFPIESLDLAAGFEYREESFEIKPGDTPSFEAGPLASQGFSVGSNGFQGFNPDDAGIFSRHNIALYLDVEKALSDRLLMGFALRYEDFSDFGTTTNGKITARLQAADRLAFRGAISTGFRAPTAGQANVRNTATNFGNAGELVEQLIVPPTSTIGALKGGQTLTPEESNNLSLGLIYEANQFTLTFDYFSIEVTDRVALNSPISITADDVDILLAQGVADAATIDSVRFFTNDFDTTTTGYDIVLNYTTHWFNGITNIDFLYNNTETTVDRTAGSIQPHRIRQLEDGVPDDRWAVNVIQSNGPWTYLLRASYYGDFFEAHADSADLPIETPGNTLFDFEVTYAPNEKSSISLGALNFTDEYPQENPWVGVLGAQYPVTSPYGFNGGFYYLRYGYTF